MSVFIDKDKCRRCGRCSSVCPGNLIKRDSEGYAYIRRPRDCWGCTSCLKECQFEAITFFLGADIGGRGSTLRYKKDGDLVIWKVVNPSGEIKEIQINTKEANSY